MVFKHNTMTILLVVCLSERETGVSVVYIVCVWASVTCVGKVLSIFHSVYIPFGLLTIVV